MVPKTVCIDIEKSYDKYLGIWITACVGEQITGKLGQQHLLDVD